MLCGTIVYALHSDPTIINYAFNCKRIRKSKMLENQLCNNQWDWFDWCNTRQANKWFLEALTGRGRELSCRLPLGCVNSFVLIIRTNFAAVTCAQHNYSTSRSDADLVEPSPTGIADEIDSCFLPSTSLSGENRMWEKLEDYSFVLISRTKAARTLAIRSVIK